MPLHPIIKSLLKELKTAVGEFNLDPNSSFSSTRFRDHDLEAIRKIGKCCHEIASDCICGINDLIYLNNHIDNLESERKFITEHKDRLRLGFPDMEDMRYAFMSNEEITTEVSRITQEQTLQLQNYAQIPESENIPNIPESNIPNRLQTNLSNFPTFNARLNDNRSRHRSLAGMTREQVLQSVNFEHYHYHIGPVFTFEDSVSPENS
jgi:hypothetical protein